METFSNAKKTDTLPEFQTFLLNKKLAPEKNVFFYALWASKFFNFARKKQIASNEYQENAVTEFMEALKSDPHMPEWQIRQAHDAIRLYYFHYLGLKPNHNLSAAKPDDFAPELLKETQRLIRLKHYSYSTERTYLQWIKRFLEYTRQTGKREAATALDNEDCKNFLSHLALKEKVSASTQNQAFNSILFLYRNVLCKEMGDLAQTVRAKRGQRLPVVFSVEETKRLLTCLDGKELLIASLIYGTGMRLMELARLRVKDIDMDLNTLTVRSGKGDKDRTTMLPITVKEPLKKHLIDIKDMHDRPVSETMSQITDSLHYKATTHGLLIPFFQCFGLQ